VVVGFHDTCASLVLTRTVWAVPLSVSGEMVVTKKSLALAVANRIGAHVPFALYRPDRWLQPARSRTPTRDGGAHGLDADKAWL
jgi:hypothetical protein